MLTPALYRERHETLLDGTPEWRGLKGKTGNTFAWSPGSTFIRRPPFFEDMEATPAEPADIRGARVLGMFGDMFTTDLGHGYDVATAFQILHHFDEDVNVELLTRARDAFPRDVRGLGPVPGLVGRRTARRVQHAPWGKRRLLEAGR